jgi:hypothetical protein
MSEEEKAIKRLKEITNNYSLNSEDLHYAIVLYHLIINLQQENQKLKDSIDKAIEYIENPRHEMSVNTYQNLLEILKGDKNE